MNLIPRPKSLICGLVSCCVDRFTTAVPVGLMLGAPLLLCSGTHSGVVGCDSRLFGPLGVFLFVFVSDLCVCVVWCCCCVSVCLCVVLCLVCLFLVLPLWGLSIGLPKAGLRVGVSLFV